MSRHNNLPFYLLQTLLLGLRYEELSWDFAKPSTTDDLDCLPCIFIQVSRAVWLGMKIHTNYFKCGFKLFYINVIRGFRKSITLIFISN